MKTTPTPQRLLMASLALALLSTLNAQRSSCFAQGSLTPPGAPAPTMKTLSQLEPRTPVESLPFFISQPGSYYLTTNLTGTTGANGITILSSDVTLDLNGFALTGVPASFHGIVLGGVVTNIVVRNGTVRGWSALGIQGANARNSQFKDLALADNGGDGISAGAGNSISGCVASGNATNGIACTDGCIITGCVATSNGGAGIAAGNASTISGCLSRLNGTDGIQVASDCQVSNNHCVSNGQGGSGAGIHAQVTKNRIDSNHLVSNTWGVKTDTSNLNIITRNTAIGNTTNYLFTGYQIYGPTNNPTLGGEITNGNAWINFSF